mmetsp:Transcript_24529/g.48834  ORF Transcript_24529/g.48834 Transcript_24529/m.48834 type:complete len:85 (-) Transcript_24529:166-420(-)
MQYNIQNIFDPLQVCYHVNPFKIFHVGQIKNNNLVLDYSKIIPYFFAAIPWFSIQSVRTPSNSSLLMLPPSCCNEINAVSFVVG